MNNQKGITIITLVITIVLLLIITSVVSYNSLETLEETRKTAFISELEIVQAKVNTIHEKMKTNTKDLEYYNNTGQDITNVSGEKLTNVLGGNSKDGFRYFNSEDLKNLGLDNIKQEVIINYNTREVISLTGIKVKGQTYYKLKDIPGYTAYNVEYIDKTVSNPSFKIEKTKIEENVYRFTLRDIKLNDYTGIGEVRYKLHNSTNWISNGQDYTFTVENPGIYDIKLTNKSGKSTVLQEHIYVQKGLIAHYDGVYNTRAGNNPQSTTWEDLSGNKNDAIGYNMDTAKGYYSKEEQGYVFLENPSVFVSKNNLQITGDDNFTIESVMKILGPAGNVWSVPVWIGRNSGYHLGGVVYPWYDTKAHKFGVGYINANNIYSDDIYENVIGNTTTFSWRKVITGQLSKGDKDYIKINFNGEIVNSTYTGNSSFTQNLTAGCAVIGRGYQQDNRNETCNAAIKNIRIYNRDLTDEEIKINYEIDEYRFNITK